MPLITEDGIPHTLRAGEESITPEPTIRYTAAASNTIRVALFAFFSFAIVVAFRGAFIFAGVLLVFAAAAFFIMRGVDRNRPWARPVGIAYFTFIGGLFVISVFMSGAAMLAMANGDILAPSLTLLLIGCAGLALCYFPHRWFAPPK